MVENTYEIQDAEYNSNRRTSKRRTKSKQLPGVSPLVFSRFLLEYTAFLSLSDMGKDLPDYEEIPVPLEMPEDVRTAYKEAEHKLQKVLRTDRKAAQKILSTYLNLLTVYPDQPYDQAGGSASHKRNAHCNAKELRRFFPSASLRRNGYWSWCGRKRQRRARAHLYQLDAHGFTEKSSRSFCSEGYRTEILTPQIATDKAGGLAINKRVKNGLQVLITNPALRGNRPRPQCLHHHYLLLHGL